MSIDLAKLSANLPLGTATWGNAFLRNGALFQRSNFWLGNLPDGRALGFGDDRHVLVTSGTRSGKGTSVIIPNLAGWLGSVVVIDPKGENAIVTARARGNGSRRTYGRKQKVRILDPFQEVKTAEDDFSDLRASYNPLDAIHPDNEESPDEAARIADALIVSESSKEPFWEEAARSLLKAIILHVCSTHKIKKEDRNLMTVRRLLMSGEAELREFIRMNDPEGKAPSAMSLLFDAMRANKSFGGVVADAGAHFGALEEAGSRAFLSVVQVAATNTDFLESPGMRRCLAKSSFKLEELKTDPKGVSLYLCLPQRYTETNFRWLRMMTTLIIAQMERTKGRPKSGHPVLMVLDEFPALKRMRVVENAAAQIAGFGVKMVMVTQTLAQLKDVYKDNWETLVANSGVKLFFCNDDHFTRDYASKLVGDCEVVRHARSASQTKGRNSNWSETTSYGETESATHGFSSSMGSSGSSLNSSFGTSSSRTYGTSYGRSSTQSGGDSRSETVGVSESIQKRRLVSPDEVGRLFGDRDNPTALVLVSGHQPYFVKRYHYFRKRGLRGWFDAHPDHPPPPTLKELAVIRARERREEEEAEERRKAAARRKEEDARRKAAEEEARRYQGQLKREAEEARLKRAEDIRVWTYVGLALAGSLVLGAFYVSPHLLRF